jgi:hypothetical protein
MLPAQEVNSVFPFTSMDLRLLLIPTNVGCASVIPELSFENIIQSGTVPQHRKGEKLDVIGRGR